MKLIFFIISLVFSISGCATIDREVSLGVPEVSKDSGNGALVYIVKPKSLRVFQQNQRDIKKPSYNGYVRDAEPSELNNVIGRFINPITDDKQGVVRLKDGRSVQEEIERLVSVGLEQRGYVISDNKNAQYEVRVTIDEFWAWNEDGGVALSLNSIIRCDVIMSSQDGDVSFNVTGHGSKKAMIASTANWQDSYQRAAKDFLYNFGEAIKVSVH